MKATNDCYPCLANLVRQAAGLATEDPELRARAIEEGLSLLDREFSTEKVSIAVATPLHRVVRRVTGNPDPYRRMKEAEVDMASNLLKGRKSNPEATLRDNMILAVLGNNIDFFKDLKQIEKDMGMPVEFALDHVRKLEEKLKRARRILYLGDNAGEVLFDLPLVRRLECYAPVTYVVKESPVQNDITLSDLKKFDLEKELPRVITTGTDTPGVDMAMASDEFRSEFEAADLVLAKGMGYWETLSELKPQGKVFYLLKAKCKPVADSLGVELNSYVALLR
jgi:uncharacterized protein with ATP-grasp and redox domains